MKKIFLILISFYTFSFSETSPLIGLSCTDITSTFKVTYSTATCEDSSSTGYSTLLGYPQRFQNNYTAIDNGSNKCRKAQTTTNYMNCTSVPTDSNQPTGDCQGGNIIEDTYGYLVDCQSGNLLPNPETGQTGICNDLFEKDGIAYTCNPNNNEATPIDNSSGLMPDPEDPDNNIPKCNDGYDYTSIPNLTVGGSGNEVGYTSWGCSPSNSTGDIPTDNTNTNPDSPTTVTNPDGSTTMTMPDGTTYHTTGDGSVTTTYPDGTSTTTYPDGTSTTGGGTDSISGGNTGGGTGGGSEDTTGENNSDNGSNDLPSDNVADNCNDTNLSLQEKMLCELNEGMKKQNSESNPTDSLNNLFKDLRDNQMQDNTAMNQNLKDIESLNKEIKALNSSQLSTLNATKTATVAIASEVSKSNGFLESIGNGVTAITDFLTTITDLISDPSEIGTKLTDKLSEVANKFTQEFISVGTCPSIQTVSANYHGTTITFLSQDLINNYFPIDIMRTIIILTFAFSGAMTFFRGAN